MRRFSVLIAVLAASAVCLPARGRAQQASPIAGAWTLNKTLSEMPREIGFDPNWFPPPTSTGRTGSTSGGRGRRASGGGGNTGGAPFSAPRSESYDEARRLQLLTAEARNPPTRLIIVDTPAAVTMTNELGQSRVLRPNVKNDVMDVERIPLIATTTRDSGTLVVLYHVEQDREIRYTYSRAANSPQLTVDVEFLDHGHSEKARRIYDPGVATETATPPAAAPPASVPASSGSAKPETFDARPGAELRGLKSLGILVEDLSTTATACGLNHDAIETALSKRLTDGGFTVRRNSDEDTYVYVNVMTTSLPSGTCVSRYDAFLYTHATANLTYRDQPVLVQVSLIHRGGIGSSAPVGHAGAVTRGLEDYIGLFITQIRDANK
jgi:hypothetical protein